MVRPPDLQQLPLGKLPGGKLYDLAAPVQENGRGRLNLGSLARELPRRVRRGKLQDNLNDPFLSGGPPCRESGEGTGRSKEGG